MLQQHHQRLPLPSQQQYDMNHFRSCGSSSSCSSTDASQQQLSWTLRMVSRSEEAASLDAPGTTPPFSVTLEEENYDYRQAMKRTGGWVGAATLFGTALWAVAGPTVGEEFFAGYLVEQSLSVDNLFVFLMLFEYFKVPLNYQDRVLNWGIYGAIVMRAIMIGLGAAALENFHAILLVFASILIYSSAQFFLGGGKEEEEDVSENTIVRFSSSLIKATDKFDGKKFFTIENGIRKATPLFICMIAVEISDVVFAVDSIPAVFGVTQNPLVVFTSNLFAIMGLRSLYTILSKAATDLKYLEPAVAVVLGFIGSKMVAEYFGYDVPTNIALLVVASVLGVGVSASLIEKQNELKPSEE
jgi:TerC family integral membrane protein